MDSDAWTSHRGLVNAIGPYSDDIRIALSKALSYLGISCETDEKAATVDVACILSLSSESTLHSTEQVTFDSKAQSWYHGSQAGNKDDGESRSSQIRIPMSDLSKDAIRSMSTSTARLGNIFEDWTTLLPATKHVHFLKTREWQKTNLGPMLEWPYSLRLMVMKMLDDPRPANLYWGSSYIAIYNESFSVIAASRHPMMMGSTAEAAMPTTYPFLSIIFDEIRKSNVAFSMPAFEMSVEKVPGFIEEAWYDGGFSPIRDDDGTFLGLYNSGNEITDFTFTQRNAQVIHRVAAGPTLSTTSSWQHLIDVYSEFDRDIPFLVLYSIDEPDDTSSGGFSARYQGSLGIEKGHSALPEFIDPYDGNEGFMPLLRVAVTRKSSVLLEMPDGELPAFLQSDIMWRGHGDACTHIVATPLYVTGLITGYHIIGLNPRRPYDEAHRQFVEDLIRASTGLLSLCTSAEQASRREEKLTREITERQRFLQRIAEVATVGLFMYSPKGLLIWGNPMYFDISGITQKQEERYNYQSLDYFVEDDQEKGKTAFVRCMETRSTDTLELRLKKTWRPPGAERIEPCWVMTTMTPNVENDEVIDVSGCITDISHLKWAEQLQIETTAAAERAKQQQERFIDITSHEMRNPLSAIIQCADDISTVCLKHEKPLELEGGRDFGDSIQTIEENAKNILFCAAHQNRIVDDILTASKLESSMLSVTPVPVDLKQVVVQAMQAFATEIKVQEIHSSLEIQQSYNDLDLTSAYCDPFRLTQVFINLLTNAIKFTKSGQRKNICVRISAATDRPILHDPTGQVKWYPSDTCLDKRSQPPVSEIPGEALYVMFEVEDSGAGISEGEMTMLFKKFAQATPKTQITYGGSGLGLFISRQLVELQGGMIGVSSQPGIGSTFAFYIETRRAIPSDNTIPRLVPHSTHEEIPEPTSGKQGNGVPKDSAFRKSLPPPPLQTQLRSILFVEDNLINQRVLTKQMERLGCTVHIANHGIEALDIIKNSVHWKGHEPGSLMIDVVLMDWEMPIMDGVACTKQIRELQTNGFITKHLCIIGTTANARLEQIETALSAGMDDVIVKPFTVTALMKRVEDLIADDVR